MNLSSEMLTLLKFSICKIEVLKHTFDSCLEVDFSRAIFNLANVLNLASIYLYQSSQRHLKFLEFLFCFIFFIHAFLMQLFAFVICLLLRIQSFLSQFGGINVCPP